MFQYFLAGFVVGVVLGAAIALSVGLLRWRTVQRQMRDAFSALAGEALDANARRLTEAAGTALEGKKAVIDQAVEAVNKQLLQVRQFLQNVEAERKQDFGSLSSSVASLSTTAGELHKMLASSQRRGAWGERMADDVIRLVGLQEGINYTKQSMADADQGKPDFTFFLPNDLKANMDVKFPLEHYKAYLDADSQPQRQAQLQQLATAVRGHVRAVASRGYIDPKVPTVPYVIVFIPSEQIYGLVLGHQPDLIDEALRQKVVLASPLTLYAMLAVIRQAAESANLMRTANEVVQLLGQFEKQWTNYSMEFDKLGDRIEQVAKQYQFVKSTRTNTLQKPLDRIEDLRQSRSLPEQ